LSPSRETRAEIDRTFFANTVELQQGLKDEYEPNLAQTNTSAFDRIKSISGLPIVIL
jgi:hypothetical protein